MSGITIVAGDRTGLIAEVTELLAARGVDIAFLDGRVVGEDAVLRAHIDDLSAALAVLTEAGFQVMSDDVVVFQIEDTPGSLARAARELADGKLDIRTVHTVSRSAGRCVVAITTDDNTRARALLGERLL